MFGPAFPSTDHETEKEPSSVIPTRSAALLTPARPLTPEPRWDKIRALRRAIARGEYETEARWAETIARLLARHPDLDA